MFKFDSTHGRYPGAVMQKEGKLVIDGMTIQVFNEYVCWPVTVQLWYFVTRWLVSGSAFCIGVNASETLGDILCKLSQTFEWTLLPNVLDK